MRWGECKKKREKRSKETRERGGGGEEELIILLIILIRVHGGCRTYHQIELIQPVTGTCTWALSYLSLITSLNKDIFLNHVYVN